jgi:hypothetical protein
MNQGFAKVGSSYSYGVDAKGQMYIYDQAAGKMIYYGSQSGGAPVINSLTATGGAVKYEGNQYVQPKAAAPTQKAAVQNTVAAPTGAPLSQTPGAAAAGAGAGTGAAPKVLDTAQLGSLDSLLGTIDSAKESNKQKAAVKRDTAKREKDEEKTREKGKYEGKKLGTLQEFAGAKTDTDLNTRNTIENLISSLSTMGLGGSRALTRQILDAANMSNRKANATQATNNQGLDSAFNEFSVGNSNDVKKIDDQYGYDSAEADRKWAQERQTALYKKADVYGAADHTAERESVMNEGNGLNDVVKSSVFLNPSYTGEARAMATPELGDYSQDIANYDTTSIGAGVGGMTPVGGAATPGNLAIKAIAVNDKDLGVKKKTESDLGYGV